MVIYKGGRLASLPYKKNIIFLLLNVIFTTINNKGYIMNTVKTKEDAGNKFSLYFGIAVEDKLPNAETLHICILELNPFVEGEIKQETETVQVGDDTSGIRENATLSNSIEADYFSILTNRRYAPDVKKGEQVFVFRYADSRKYYWFPIGRDDYLRRTERYTIGVSNNQTTPNGLSDNNSYTLELDTKYNKHIFIKTSKTDGEKFQYLIKIDAKQNTVHICDDNDNQILLDSNVPRIFLSNSEGAFIDIVKKNVMIAALEDVIIKAGRQFVLDTPIISSQNTIGSGATEFNSRNMTFNANGSFVVNSPSIGLNGAVVANSVVADGVLSSGYSTGHVSISRSIKSVVKKITTKAVDTITQYIGTVVNIFTGTATTPSNPPRGAAGDGSNRYCAAWDHTDPAFDTVCEAIEKIAKSPYVNVDVSSLVAQARELSKQSKMLRNRGE